MLLINNSSLNFIWGVHAPYIKPHTRAVMISVYEFIVSLSKKNIQLAASVLV